MVGGGIVPATNFTRHEVHRPRPPQVAVMSTWCACAARRSDAPGSAGTVLPSGRKVTGTVATAPF